MYPKETFVQVLGELRDLRESSPRRTGYATSSPTDRDETGVLTLYVSCLHIKFGHKDPTPNLVIR